MNVNKQKKKVVLLASSVACLNLPGLLILRHLHDSRYLITFVICWLLLMVSLLVFATVELMKLVRRKRGATR
ncbi:MAG TPA: hypothetical protein VFC39_13700 [Acidobacteriaceae bacterium]|nr:hypothetical protein [Acidobacteriaceae bacterium]